MGGIMKHYHIECSLGYPDCMKCKLLKECFPKTYERRQKAIIQKWKDKYGDEF